MTIPLARRFPAAHQFLRHRLIEEVYPIAAWVSCSAQQEEADAWRVRVYWPEIDFDAAEQFSADDLRRVYGRWSNWARRCALDVADRLPV